MTRPHMALVAPEPKPRKPVYALVPLSLCLLCGCVKQVAPGPELGRATPISQGASTFGTSNERFTDPAYGVACYTARSYDAKSVAISCVKVAGGAP
jgi:hypothetical protein